MKEITYPELLFFYNIEEVLSEQNEGRWLGFGKYVMFMELKIC
jgi:hypothetical protein